MLTEITLGWLGLHPWEVERYTLKELAYKISGFLDNQQAQQVEHWRQARIITTALYNTAGKSFKKTIQPTDIIKLPTDKKARSKVDDMREAFKRITQNG
jgi:hypothetical protein